MDTKTEKKKDASSFVKTALQMYREGKAQASIIEFQKALEVDPENKQAQAYIKAIQGEMENQGKALQFYQAATTYKQQNDLPNALANIEQVLALDPNHEQANMLIREIKKTLQQQKAQTKANGFNQGAIDAYKAGDLLGALVLWDKAFEVNSDLTEVSKYIQQGISQILSVGVDGLEANPDKTAILGMFEQGIRSYVKGDFQSAAESFKRGLSKAEGNVYLNAYLQKAVQMEENQVQEFYDEGLQLLQSGELAQAQKQFTKVLRLSPGHPDAMRQLEAVKGEVLKSSEKMYADGKQYFDANDMDRAIRIWSGILEIDPTNDKIQKKIEEAKIKKNTLKDIFSKIS
jgi:tetratricopeptide (TPR) repeat protein